MEADVCQLISSPPGLPKGVHILKCPPHLTAQNQEDTNYAKRIRHVIKMTQSQEGSLLNVDPASTFFTTLCHQQKAQSMIQLLALEKKGGKSKRKHPS
jgi:hypothetical protein